MRQGRDVFRVWRWRLCGYCGGNLRVRLLLVGALLGLLLPAILPMLHTSAAPAITEYPVPTAKGTPRGITRGPDGNLWFVEFYGNKIGKITTGGAITEYPLPTAGLPQEIAAGPDGNLWFTEFGAGAVGRITLSGAVTEYPIRPLASGRVEDIVGGPDGNVWFTQTDKVSRITPAGAITDFPFAVPGGSLGAIARGADGNLWFTEYGANHLGRITPAGAITEFGMLTDGRGAEDLTAGPDGNLWFTEINARMVGKITPGGEITEYPVPAPAAELQNIAAGPDGNLWFAADNNYIASMTPDGAVAEYAIPTDGSEPRGIIAGPDGNIWFTENTGNKIGVVVLSGGAGGSQGSSGSFAAPAFQQQWQQGEALAPNFWGPAVGGGMQEPYAESPGGTRLVQYFDKGRMELTTPGNGMVTNGLLANELITGQMQLGDNVFETRAAAAIPIAGDPDNPGPTYAALGGTAASLLAPVSAQMGNAVTTRVAANGAIAQGGATVGTGPTALTVYDGVTQHNVPQAFAQYRDTVGLLTIGYAKSEPFLATVKVAGAPRDVMVQVFERRVLTYTASNPNPYKVEMGNIGQHYYRWR